MSTFDKIFMQTQCRYHVSNAILKTQTFDTKFKLQIHIQHVLCHKHFQNSHFTKHLGIRATLNSCAHQTKYTNSKIKDIQIFFMTQTQYYIEVLIGPSTMKEH